MRYRRSNTPNATYFFTVNLAERHRDLLTANVDALRAAIRKVKQRHPFQIKAIVIMPDHLHAIWQLPEGDADFALRWSLIKSNFSKSLAKVERINPSRTLKRERGIWQRRYWEHQIRDDVDLQSHVDYIHYNPVKHGYVSHAVDWPYSSIHAYIKSGLLPKDWAGYAGNNSQYGE
jgi:putative transposase